MSSHSVARCPTEALRPVTAPIGTEKRSTRRTNPEPLPWRCRYRVLEGGFVADPGDVFARHGALFSGDIDEPGEVPLEGKCDVVCRTIAMLGDMYVSFTGTR